MEKPQMNGLANILAHVGTLHSLTPRPVREDYAADTEYESALKAWLDNQYWKSSRA